MRDNLSPRTPIRHTNTARQDRQRQEVATAKCRWSAIDWLCAYDSVFMLMFYVFQAGSEEWKTTWEATGPLAYSLCEMYRKLLSSESQMTSGHMFDEMRDAFRDLLFGINPNHFPWYGQVGASVSKIISELTPVLECHPLIGAVCVNECPDHICPTNAARTRNTLPTICSHSAWLQIVRDSGVGDPEASSVSTHMWVTFCLQGELNKCRPWFPSSMCAACNGKVDPRVFYEEPPAMQGWECGTAPPRDRLLGRLPFQCSPRGGGQHSTKLPLLLMLQEDLHLQHIWCPSVQARLTCWFTHSHSMMVLHQDHINPRRRLTRKKIQVHLSEIKGKQGPPSNDDACKVLRGPWDHMLSHPVVKCEVLSATPIVKLKFTWSSLRSVLSIQSNSRMTAEVYKTVGDSTSGTHQSLTPVSRFLKCKELIEEVFHNLPHMTDASAWGDTFHATRAIKCDILAKRFRNIVEPFADRHLTAVHFKVLECFFHHALGYESLEDATTPHTAILESVERFVRYMLREMVVTVSVVRDGGMFQAVVSAPCTADMTVMTPGSICTFYPSLTLNGLGVMTPTGHLVDGNLAWGCRTNSRFKVYNNTKFLGTACGESCPAIWRCVGDVKRSLVVDWDRRYSLKSSVSKSHMIWRLAESCKNEACEFRSIPGWYHPLLAPVKIPADKNKIVDVIRQMKEYSYKSPVEIHALLYATTAAFPHIVPVPLQEGKRELVRVNELEVNFWVNNVARNRFVLSTSRFRKTFHAIPDHVTLSLPYLYSVFRENPKGFPPPNALIKEICPRVAAEEVMGNILVVKHTKNNKNKVLDMSEADIQLVNLLLEGYMDISRVGLMALTVGLTVGV
ncbi:hypothetical protein F4604DRAFT_1683000 [Suillus subluteus]|nr:hypothetical protein F4604DRAFT_1683000 [Suillus subluteus]